MPYFLAPDPAQSTFFVPGTNTPAAGAQIFTYLTGTTTKVTVYKDDAGAASHTNPIVLDAGGNLPSASAVWLLGGQAYRFVWAPSNDTDPPASPYRTMDDISGINDVSVAASLQWVAGPAPTFVGATRLTLSGDQTGNAQIGRRIETTNTGGTIYSTITSSVFSASTTAIGVNNDSGSLDAGLSSLNYGLLTRVNPSIPVLTDFFPLRSSSSDATKNWRVETGAGPSSTTLVETLPMYSFRPATQNRGAQVSSQSTTNVSTATGDLIEITNTNAISQFTMFNGQLATLRFATTTPINYSANIPLPGTESITTAAGDMMTLRGTSTDAVLIQSYQLAAQYIRQPAEVILAASTHGNTSAIAIVMTAYSSWPNKRVLFEFIPVTDAVTISMRVSSSNGATYDAGASDYGYAFSGSDSASTAALSGATSAQIVLSFPGNVGNGANEGINGFVEMFNTTSNALWPRFKWRSTTISADTPPRIVSLDGGGMRQAIQQTNAIQFRPSSGNFSSAAWRLYGMN